MKIVLDVSDLVERGQLTPTEAERLIGLSASNASSVGINLLVGFGLVAVVASVGALVPSATTAVLLGALLCAAGFAVRSAVPKTWDLLGQMCIVVGVLALSGGLVALDAGSLRTALLVVALIGTAGVLVRSGLLVALAVVALGACLGSSTDYRHAFYALSIEQPTLTILVFSAIAAAAYAISLRVRAANERLALIAARVATLSVNFGFWIGSLWGDDLEHLRSWLNHGAVFTPDYHHPLIPASVFGVGWALGLVAVGAWALRRNRMWVVNTVGVFAAIHFYTQWFETLGANPFAVLGAGLLTLVVALVLWRLKRTRMEAVPA